MKAQIVSLFFIFSLITHSNFLYPGVLDKSSESAEVDEDQELPFEKEFCENLYGENPSLSLLETIAMEHEHENEDAKKVHTLIEQYRANGGTDKQIIEGLREEIILQNSELPQLFDFMASNQDLLE